MVSIPPGFFSLLTFTALLNLFPFFINETVNPLRYALNFNLGVLGYLFFYNYNQSFHLITKSIKYLSFLYAGLYLLSFIFPIELAKFAFFIFPQTDPTIHFNLGLIWGFYALTEVAQKGVKVKPHLIIITLVFAVISFNRTVILGIILGLLYLANGEVSKIFTKWKVGFTLLSIIILLFMGLSKTTIFNRPYFFQSIKVFFDNIWGVGLGNFGLVSSSTSFAHSILLEIVSGLGIFSIPFVVWMFKVYKNLTTVGQENFFIKSVQLSTLVILLFTPNYIIFGFMWFWFLCIGIEEEES